MNLLRGDSNDFLESRTKLLRPMDWIEEALAIRRYQPAPEAVPNNSRQVQQLLKDLRVDSAEDPEVHEEPIESVRSQPASIWMK